MRNLKSSILSAHISIRNILDNYEIKLNKLMNAGCKSLVNQTDLLLENSKEADPFSGFMMND